MSWTILSTSAVKSARRSGSFPISSRAKASVAPTMASMSASVDSIFSRSSTSATFSARSRSSVNGVRRSCETAANSRVRFSINSRRRTCISLKAREAWRVSMLPVSAIGGALTSWPRRWAAPASAVNGAVTRRVAQIEATTMTKAMTIMAMMN